MIDGWNPHSINARLCGAKWHVISPPNRLYYFTHRFLGDMNLRIYRKRPAE